MALSIDALRLTDDEIAQYFRDLDPYRPVADAQLAKACWMLLRVADQMLDNDIDVLGEFAKRLERGLRQADIKEPDKVP